MFLDDCDQSDLFREEKDEQTYSQTDCYVWLKSGIRKRGRTRFRVFHMVAELRGS